MGNSNSIDVGRPITNERTCANGIVRNDTAFHEVDWRGELDALADRAKDDPAAARALEYNTRLFAFLAAEGRRLGYGGNES